MRKTIFMLILLAAIFSLSACEMDDYNIAEGTPVVLHVATETTALESAEFEDLPESDLFPIPWSDRSPFHEGLLPESQHWADEFPMASLYRVELNIPQSIETITGRQEVVYTNQEEAPLEEIILRLFPNINGGSAAVSGLHINGNPVEGTFENQESTLWVPLDQPLEAGASLLLQLNFSLTIPREMGGNYGLFGFFNEVLMLDTFLPTIPAYDDEGWYAETPPRHGDLSYYDASFYLVSVTAPEALVLVASGVEIESSRAEGVQEVTFAAGPARDFSLAASETFTVVSEMYAGVQVNSYAFAGQENAQAAALESAGESVQFFGEWIGGYDYTEFDVAATPMQAGGIEYPGMTWINQDLYNLERTDNLAAAYGILRSVVVHEVGHQWFYNTVGNSQFHEPWLDESLVQYITGIFFLETYGPEAYDSLQASWNARWSNISFDELPIGMGSDAYTGGEYVAAVYGRGPFFFETLSERMGKEAFDAFISDYYASYQWEIAETEDMKDLAEDHCDCDLTELFDEWVYPQE